jgi:hypothetical protein
MSKRKVSTHSKLTEHQKLLLVKRIAHLSHTLGEIASLPPELGSKWQQGMVRYYTRLYNEAIERLNGTSRTTTASVTKSSTSI